MLKIGAVLMQNYSRTFLTFGLCLSSPVVRTSHVPVIRELRHQFPSEVR